MVLQVHIPQQLPPRLQLCLLPCAGGGIGDRLVQLQRCLACRRSGVAATQDLVVQIITCRTV